MHKEGRVLDRIRLAVTVRKASSDVMPPLRISDEDLALKYLNNLNIYITIQNAPKI